MVVGGGVVVVVIGAVVVVVPGFAVVVVDETSTPSSGQFSEQNPHLPEYFPLTVLVAHQYFLPCCLQELKTCPW